MKSKEDWVQTVVGHPYAFCEQNHLLLVAGNELSIKLQILDGGDSWSKPIRLLGFTTDKYIFSYSFNDQARTVSIKGIQSGKGHLKILVDHPLVNLITGDPEKDNPFELHIEVL